MDDLERQMGYLREQMQRTLSRVEGPDRRRTIPDRLRASLSGLLRRVPTQDTEEPPENSEASFLRAKVQLPPLPTPRGWRR